MAYQVLARKWRPKNWDEVAAQDHVTVTLRNAIQHQRLAHAYLFTGPRGVGKTSAARILAKALNCDKGPAVQPCDSCSSCVEIAESRNVDVLEIDGASNRGIEDVRNLRENIRYAPVGGRYKVYIIDEVHMLTHEAFNALLKTLEEPPEHVLFIFATTEPHKVPATIVSRCQRFDFHRISVQDIVQSLRRICASESLAVSDDALLLIAQKSDGSLRDSQSLLDQIVSYAGGRIDAEDVVKALGMIGQEMYFEASRHLAARDVSRSLALVETVFAQGYSVDEFLSGLTEHFRNLLVVRAAGTPGAVEASDDTKKLLVEASKGFQDEDLLRLIKMVTEAQHALKRGMHPRFVLELVFVKMAKLDRSVSIQDLLAQIADLKKSDPDWIQPPSAAGAPPSDIPAVKTTPLRETAPSRSETPHVPAPPAVRDADPAPGAFSLEDIQSRWNEVIQEVKSGRVTAGTFLQEGVPVGLEGNTVIIGFRMRDGFHIDAINRADDIIRNALKKVYGKTLQFRCVKGEFAQLDDASASKRIAGSTDHSTSPVIDMLSRELGAELV